MAKKYLKICSLFLAILDTQIKITSRYLLIQVRTVKTKTRDNKC